MSKEWLNRLKIINKYLPRMKSGQKKYSEEELIEKIVQNNTPGQTKSKYVESGAINDAEN